MRLLLDTHCFLWWCTDDPRLGGAERDAIGDAANEVFLSAASIWELAIKRSLGRIEVPEAPGRAAHRFGFLPLPISFGHAERVAELPPLHRDPFDRMLVAQAMCESLTVVTHDPAVRAYPGLGLLPEALRRRRARG